MEQTLGWTLSELAEIIGGELHGPPELRITKPVPAGDGSADGITFAESARYLALVEGSSVAAVIVALDEEGCSKPHIRCKSPREAFGRVLAMSWRELPLGEGVHATAIVAEDATIDNGACVGAYAVVESGTRICSTAKVYAHCYVGADCHLSDGVKLYPNVTLYRDVFLGERVIVHSGTVIGADGFGYFWDGARHRKVPQVGRVIIEDDCEIGANVTIDRATAGSTSIRRGTKIDNLVQVAHNVVVGSDTVIAALSGIAGSASIGSRVTFGGHVVVADHGSVCDDVVVGGASAVLGIEEPGVYLGTPASPINDERRRMAVSSKLPELLQRIRALESEVKKLKERS